MALKLRILIIEKDPVLCELLVDMLLKDGHLPTAALAAKDGLRKFDTRPFDLVICGKKTGRITGQQVGALIKRRLDAPPVILMTGSVPGMVPEHADAVLIMPFSANDLRQAVEEAIRRGTRGS